MGTRPNFSSMQVKAQLLIDAGKGPTPGSTRQAKTALGRLDRLAAVLVPARRDEADPGRTPWERAPPGRGRPRPTSGERRSGVVAHLLRRSIGADQGDENAVARADREPARLHVSRASKTRAAVSAADISARAVPPPPGRPHVCAAQRHGCHGHGLSSHSASPRTGPESHRAPLASRWSSRARARARITRVQPCWPTWTHQL
jgi:hypothetical protein